MLASTRFRLNPGRGAAVALLVLAVVVVAISGGWVLASRPARLASAGLNKPIVAASLTPGGSLASPSAGGGAAAKTAAPPAPASNASSPLVVDVVGKVRRPGVYHLPTGSRVVDAVGAAGGATPGTDLAATNLARRVIDGEQIAIGVAVQAGAAAGPGGVVTASGGEPAAATAQAPLDLNTATEAQLDALPGVGPVLAQHILEWRAAHGRFDSVNQLNSVSGIGDAKYADLSPLVAVG